jgi:hypothetical protein
MGRTEKEKNEREKEEKQSFFASHYQRKCEMEIITIFLSL